MRSKILSILFVSFSLIPAYTSNNDVAPQPVIVVLGGHQAPVNATLLLWGEESYSASGLQIIRWEWSVQQPTGSQSTFYPSALTANPTFPVTVAGTYTFSLHVWDEQSVKSQQPDTYAVSIIVYDSNQDVQGTGGDDTQITFGTVGKDMIIQHGRGGNDTQYVGGDAGDDWIEQYGDAGNDTRQ